MPEYQEENAVSRAKLSAQPGGGLWRIDETGEVWSIFLYSLCVIS